MLDPRARARFARNRAALIGGGIVVALILFAVLGPLFSSIDPNASDFEHGLSPERGPIGPSSAHLLGTDRLFRDELCRLAHGARLSILIGIAATAIASIIGAAVGIVAGYYEGSDGVRVPWVVVAALICSVLAVIYEHPGWAVAILATGAMSWATAMRARSTALLDGPQMNGDVALMRLVDVGLSFPFLLLVMALGAALEKTTATSILVTLGLTGWLGAARVVRAKTMQIRNLDFIVAARALGQSTIRILWKHVLPNTSGTLIVIATISVAQMIIAESVLSYLGIGISPPTPTWGHMLFEGQDYYMVAPWLFIAPACAILLAVLGFNMLGEGLRDAFDPKED